MDLAFTAAQQQLRSEFRTWLTENLPSDWDARGGALPDNEDDATRFLIDWERRLYAGGYAGMAVSSSYGGQGRTILEHFIICEELGRRAAPEGINSIGRELVIPILLAVGSEEQKRRFIPEILAGREIWCQGFSEPEAGSDLASVRTSALRGSDGWSVNGQKVWTSFAQHAQWCLLLARTGNDASKHQGLTLFLMPMSARGVRVRPLGQITGRAEFNEVFIDDVLIPDENVVGELGRGWVEAGRVLATERATNRLYRQARFVNELKALVELANQEGRNAFADGALRQKLGALWSELEILRYHYLKMVSRVLNGNVIGAESSVLKLFWSKAHQRLAALALDVLGPQIAAAHPSGSGRARFQDLYLQSRGETIYAGTTEIQRSIIADRVLNLPK
jgi:alkylation response protein AidB-like acyl-CoA dehydrogenase